MFRKVGRSQPGRGGFIQLPGPLMHSRGWPGWRGPVAGAGAGRRRGREILRHGRRCGVARRGVAIQMRSRRGDPTPACTCRVLNGRPVQGFRAQIFQHQCKECGQATDFGCERLHVLIQCYLACCHRDRKRVREDHAADHDKQTARRDKRQARFAQSLGGDVILRIADLVNLHVFRAYPRNIAAPIVGVVLAGRRSPPTMQRSDSPMASHPVGSVKQGSPRVAGYRLSALNTPRFALADRIARRIRAAGSSAGSCGTSRPRTASCRMVCFRASTALLITNLAQLRVRVNAHDFGARTERRHQSDAACGADARTGACA